MGAGQQRDTHGGTQTAPGNLPVRLTRLVGRDAALGELRSAMWRTRMLTLCGPGGAGKTTLAAALAEAVRADFVGGAWWVDLSSTLDSGLVAQAAAAALLPDEPAMDPVPAAISRRFTESALLVLDNCEQVVEGSAELAVALLARSPSLRIVATSRQPLGVPGDQVWRVPGLRVESSGRELAPTSEEAGEEGAVTLFVERAREANIAFDPEPAAVRESVRQICEWLDGMPLAIELAAARVAVLSVAQIAQRLEQDATLLRQRRPGAPVRHRTLQATLEWSIEMLQPVERQLFCRLAAFRGSFSLAAAEFVCADEAIPPEEVLDVLSVLVDRSLVVLAEIAEAPRYRLLATVRQYGLGALEQSGEAEMIRERHARYFLELALSGSVPETEHDNFGEAVQWLITHSPHEAVGLCSALWPFWYRHGYYREARMSFEQTLAAAPDLSDAECSQALIGAGEVAFLQCDYADAARHLSAGLERIDAAEHWRLAATALQRLGAIAREQGRYSESRELHERSLEIWEEHGDAQGVAASKNYLGFVAWLAGECGEAESLCLAALSHFRRTDDLQNAAATLVNLGAAALYGGELAVAEERLTEALSISRKLGFQEGIAWALQELAIVGRRRRHAVRDNASRLRDALLIHRRLGDRWRVASVLEESAAAVLTRQDPRQAAEVLAAAETLRAQLGTPIPVAERPDRDALLARLLSRLGQRAFATAWPAGEQLELDQAIDQALAGLEAAAGDAAGAGDPGSKPVLTSRELAVLELLSDGHTNREIAAALYISPSTAGVHVSNILRKLGAKRRVDATGLAHKLGLLPTR